MEERVDRGAAVRVEKLGAKGKTLKGVSSLGWCDLSHSVAGGSESSDGCFKGTLNGRGWRNDACFVNM